MVFSNLGTHEKEAFFDLLDEYFTARPDLLASLGGTTASEGEGSSPSLYTAKDGVNSRAAASAVHSALAANPEATASLVSSGLRHGAQNSNVKNSPFANAASNPAIANSIGRVAAASLAFGKNNNGNAPPLPPSAARSTPPPPSAVRNTPPPPPAARAMPPALPRRTSSQSQEQQEQEEEDADAPPPPSRSPLPRTKSGASGLVTGRSFGDVDTTSFKGGFLSVKNGTINKSKPPPSVTPPIPSAFPKRQNNFAPPPVRRVTSDSTPPTPVRALAPEPEPEPEEEQGEWAEALYDYDSGESGDLVMSAHQRIKIMSRDSDDWWTGELDGKTGLFPASYVRIL